jgi:hypothetical protein
MSDHWQLTSAFNWTRRNLHSLFSEDPNAVAWNSNNTDTTGWTFKASGSYLFRWGLLAGFSYSAMKGEPYGRFLTVVPEYLTLADPGRTSPLVQGNMTITAEKAGTYYLPTIRQTNLRLQKEIKIRRTMRLHVMFNVFNFFDEKTVIGVNQSTGQYFNLPTAYLGGAVVRVSTRFTF